MSKHNSAAGEDRVTVEQRAGDAPGRMELLAPAGEFAAFKAGVENGADAVYLGGKHFNARAGAANFDLQELAKAVKYAHDRQVKVYVTVNILIADEELPELVDYVFQLYQTGVDALIVQDLGVATMLRAVLPELELHASTQMTVNNSWAVRHLERVGFRRVVLARENSAREIKQIRNSTPLEIEVFVHGALCVCYSGQCLMSSFIGGRSGNRGRCAQPCRLAYQLVDEGDDDVLKDRHVGEYLLSPRDLNLSEELKLLRDLGVDSLKIEGRMKRPEYVATVTRIYRKALDLLAKDHNGGLGDDDRYELMQIFNRDFTPGYLHGHPGKELMSYHRPNNRGTYLGRVAGRKGDYLTLKLEEPLHVGDGLEVWTKNGREGVTVDRIWRGNAETDRGLPGETVRIWFSGQACIGDRVFKTHDELLMEKARRSFQEGKEQRKRPLDVVVRGRIGELLELEARDGERRVTVYSHSPLQAALKRPLTVEYLSQQLGRLGNTPYVLRELKLELNGEGMLPVSELNEMRRQAVERLLQDHRRTIAAEEYHERLKNWQRSLQDLKSAVILREKTKKAMIKPKAAPNATVPAQLAVAVSDLDAWKAALQGGATRILFGGENWRSRPALTLAEMREGLALCREQGAEGVWRLPRILNQRQAEKLAQTLREVAEWEIRPALMLGNLGALEILRDVDPQWPFAVDYSLNVFNELTVAHFFREGAEFITLSPELHHEQIRRLASWPNLEVMVFGDLEMMVSEYCPIGATLGDKRGEHCTAPCVKQRYYLKDRMKYRFPLETDRECRMHLFNSKRLNLIAELPLLAGMGIRQVRLQLIRFQPEKVRKVTGAFRRVWEACWEKPGKRHAGMERAIEEASAILDGLEPEGFTKGHFFRGVL